MKPQSFIFIGRSGSGKGTQAKLLQEYLKKNDPTRNTLYVQSGAEFREFIKGPSATQKLSKDIYDKGGLQPEFLATFMWTNVLVKNYTLGEHLIMDGMPRKYHEAGVLDSIFDFYKITKPFVVYTDISKEESVNRLMARGRIDDNRKEIEERLSWFETEVAHALDFYRDNPHYNYLVVNGERPVQEVHEDIIAKISPKLQK